MGKKIRPGIHSSVRKRNPSDTIEKFFFVLSRKLKRFLLNPSLSSKLVSNFEPQSRTWWTPNMIDFHESARKRWTFYFPLRSRITSIEICSIWCHFIESGCYNSWSGQSCNNNLLKNRKLEYSEIKKIVFFQNFSEIALSRKAFLALFYTRVRGIKKTKNLRKSKIYESMSYLEIW